eukprot:5853463-Amphidinium_carterae.2
MDAADEARVQHALESLLLCNEDIIVKGQAPGGAHGGYGAVVLDDCNFHECVKLEDCKVFRMKG